MTFQRKSTLMMFLLGSTLLLLFSVSYYFVNRHSTIEQAHPYFTGIAHNVGHAMNLFLTAKSRVADTVASTPLLSQTLIQSNSDYKSFSETERDELIDNQNQRWRAVRDMNDPIIQDALSNPAANFLRTQQTILPGEYGEIFLTNRYGALVASTGKLTTFAHAHKYWWQGSYKDGEGITYFDDRGYDTSVEGYVLGVVVPIKHEDEIIGILKINLNIFDALTDVISGQDCYNESEILKLVRSGGVIVLEEGKEPLSTRVPDIVVDKMNELEMGSFIYEGGEESELVAYAPVNLTLKSDECIFGGSPKSIDHLSGNKGEGWYIVTSLPLGDLLQETNATTQAIILMGIIFGLVMACGAWLLSRNLTRPVLGLVKHAAGIGQGDLNTRVDVSSSDEFGVLGNSFNSMMDDLQQTMISRDLLLIEAEKRERVQQELRCLFGIGEAIRKQNTLDNIFKVVVELVPPAWRYPEITCCRICLDDLEFNSSNFEETRWRQSAEIITDRPRGTIEVFYTEERPELDEGPFNKEARTLINGIARSLSEAVEHKEAKANQEIIENQLRQAQKMEAVGELAGGIAHDFNNLLQSITCYTEIVRDKLSVDHSAYKDICRIAVATEKAAELIYQILAFSRRQVMDMSDLNLNEVVANLMNMIHRVIGDHINLKILPGHDLGTVRADPGQIEQILMNLCINARDAMPEGGMITIETESVQIDEDYCRIHSTDTPGSYVLLSVSDTGTGMDESTTANIFEPFFTTKDVGEGTGLGLSMVYGLVKQHKGSIHVYSEIGKGSVFKIYFPMTGRPVISTVMEIESSTPGGKETILLAEDNPDVLEVTTIMLENAGYTVMGATNGEEALDIFKDRSDKIDLALLDVMMPKLGGRAVCDKICAEKADMRVLFASGYSMSAIHTNFELDKGMAFIQKPYRRDKLLHAVRDAIDS